MPSVLRSSGHSARPVADRVRRADEAPRVVPSMRSSPLSARSRPNSSRASSVRPEPEQAGEAHHLARAHAEVDRLQMAALAQAVAPAAAAGAAVGITAAHGRARVACAASSRPTMARDQRRRRQLAPPAYSPTQLAVAQHGDAVGDRVDLVQEVRDEEDGQALAAQPAHHREQLLPPRRRPGWRSARRGSAPRDDARARARSPPSAAPPPGSRPSSRVTSMSRSEARQQLARAPVQRGPVDATALREPRRG